MKLATTTPSLPAQRRPGFEPRRHYLRPHRSVGRKRRAQRRPGFEPRRHISVPFLTEPPAHDPLNEGRGSNPGDTPDVEAHVAALVSALAPLNEGRGSNPGDTRAVGLCRGFGVDRHAQRRPGFEPRRHQHEPVMGSDARCQHAQRRPGFEPRRHVPVHPITMRAARLGSAQRRPGFEPRRHDDARHRRYREALHGRSTKAGVRTPATRPRRSS